jgi:hypothetical protein
LNKSREINAKSRNAPEDIFFTSEFWREINARHLLNNRHENYLLEIDANNSK